MNTRCSTILILLAVIFTHNSYGMLTRSRLVGQAGQRLLVRSSILRILSNRLRPRSMFYTSHPVCLQLRVASSNTGACYNQYGCNGVTHKPADNQFDNFNALPTDIDVSWLDYIYSIVAVYEKKNRAHKIHGLIGGWQALLAIDGLVHVYANGSTFKAMVEFHRNLDATKKYLEAINKRLEISAGERATNDLELARIAVHLRKAEEIIALLSRKQELGQ